MIDLATVERLEAQLQKFDFLASAGVASSVPVLLDELRGLLALARKALAGDGNG